MVLSVLILTLPVGVKGQAPSIYRVTPLDINEKAFSEISPVELENGILFCSNRRFSGAKDRTSFDDKRLYNIWYAEKIDSTSWGKPSEVKSERSSLFNNGPLCVAPDGKTVYFTSEVETGKITKKRKYKNHSGLFIAELQGEELIGIVPFKYNSDQYDIAQPSLSYDGRFLYFASNMRGGEGGSDIWYCELIDNEWGTPVNLGPTVNSNASENYPYIHESGKLYFSSNRAGGYGKLDIYYSTKTSGEWSEPIHMVEPINSEADDFAFVAGEDGALGYFASNRNNRNDNIYQFISTIIRKSSCDELLYNNYCYEFIEENAVKYDTIPFTYEWEFGDGEKAKGEIVEHCYPGPGDYTIRLNLENLITGEILLNQKTYFLQISDFEQPFITSLDTVRVGQSINLTADETNLPGWDIERYYWNFDDESIDVGNNVIKSWTNPGIYDVQLIVTSSKDATGFSKEACVSKKIVVE
jgi:hypothetical protein